jgi:hypothetical protein
VLSLFVIIPHHITIVLALLLLSIQVSSKFHLPSKFHPSFIRPPFSWIRYSGYTEVALSTIRRVRSVCLASEPEVPFLLRFIRYFPFYLPSPPPFPNLHQEAVGSVTQFTPKSLSLPSDVFVQFVWLRNLRYRSFCVSSATFHSTFHLRLRSLLSIRYLPFLPFYPTLPTFVCHTVRQ